MQNRFSAALAAIVLTLSVGAPALAAPVLIPGVARNAPHVPASVTACNFAYGNEQPAGLYLDGTFHATVVNRTDYRISAVAIRMRVFSASSHPVGEQVLNMRNDAGIFAHDSADFATDLLGNLSIASAARDVDHVACQIVSVTFDEHRPWTFGQPWAGHLSDPTSYLESPAEAVFGDVALASGGGVLASR